jgi:putative DNA primase/helicase
MNVAPRGVDNEMKRYQWVCWGHHGKAPTDPETGGHARHNDAATWGSWDEALALAERKGYGVGFPFQQAAPFVGLDIDVPLSEEWVPDFGRIAAAVVEESTSGNYHVFLKDVAVPEWWTDLSGDGPDTDEIGVYADSKYMTVSGKVLDGHGPPIEEVTQFAFEAWLKDAWINWHGAHLENDDYPDEVPTPPWETDTAEPGAGVASEASRSDGDQPVRRSDTADDETIDDLLQRRTEAAMPSVHDVLSGSHPEDERMSHPVHGSSSGTNFKIDEGGETWVCWRCADRQDGVTGNALHLLGVDAGIIDCGEWESGGLESDTWYSIFEEARERGFDLPRRSDVVDSIIEEADPPDTAVEASADGGTATQPAEAVNDPESSDTDPWGLIRAVLANDDQQNEPARYRAYKLVRDTFHFATFLDTEELFVYNPETGVYDEGGEATVREWLEADHRLGDQFKRSEANEIVYRIKSATFRDREEFGGDEYDPKVCVENGVLDLAEFADPLVDDPDVHLLDHSPEHLLLTRVPVTYDDDADCSGFDGFLDEILAKDADKQVIYEMIGYCLWPDYPFAKALFLYGDGRNGKSTLLDVWKQFLGGDENVSSRGLYELEMQRFASSALYGRLANIAGDLPDQELARTGTFKTLTGGDLVTAEKKYQDAFSFKNRSKLIFSANDPPKIDDDTTAMYRRLLLVNFPNEFTPAGQPGPDARPKHELLAEIANDEELSGLLNAALAGLARVFSRGCFSQNETVDQVREQYKRVSDPIYAFSKECVRSDSDGHVETDRLYNVYSAWARENEAPVKDKSVFPRKLATHLNFEKGRVGGRGGRTNVYQGIALSGRGESFADEDDDNDNDRQSYLS